MKQTINEMSKEAFILMEKMGKYDMSKECNIIRRDNERFELREIFDNICKEYEKILRGDKCEICKINKIHKCNKCNKCYDEYKQNMDILYWSY